MSLLQRVERAQQAANTAANAPPSHGAPAAPVPPPNALVPVIDPARPSSRTPAREELIREIRLILQTEIVSAFDSLVDAPPDEVRPRIEGIFDRVVTKHSLAVTRDERARLIEEMINDVTGFGPIEPLLNDESITEVMVNGPDHIYIERARQDPARRHDVPQRRARAAHHRPDHHADGPADRRVQPARRRAPPRRLARQRDHRAALAHRPRHHRPEVLDAAVHGRRPDPLRHRDARDVRVPPRVHRGPAQPVRLGRHGFRQDHDPQRAVGASSPTTSASSRSRTPPSSSSARST